MDHGVNRRIVGEEVGAVDPAGGGFTGCTSLASLVGGHRERIFAIADLTGRKIPSIFLNADKGVLEAGDAYPFEAVLAVCDNLRHVHMASVAIAPEDVMSGTEAIPHDRLHIFEMDKIVLTSSLKALLTDMNQHLNGQAKGSVRALDHFQTKVEITIHARGWPR